MSLVIEAYTVGSSKQRGHRAVQQDGPTQYSSKQERVVALDPVSGHHFGTDRRMRCNGFSLPSTILAHMTRLALALLAVAALVPTPLRAQSASSMQAAQQTSSSPASEGMHWRMIGPFRGGRTRAAAGVPSQPNVFYMGQVNGGVWKTDDAGRTWNPIFDSQPTQSIGALAVAPSDPNIVYVASGEGLRRPDLSVGNGIYRSSDAGRTWQQVDPDGPRGLHDGQQIPALVVDPTDPNHLLAAVLGHPYGPNETRGIFRSTDGGKSWAKVLYKDANTGGADVTLDPTNPRTVYATLWESRLGPWEDANGYEGTHGGVFKSTDGGDTWRPITKGFPADLVQVHLAVAPSQPNRIYATISTKHESGYASGAGLGVYRSDDAGESWHVATDDPRPAMKIGGGDLPVPVVDPKNPDIVYSTSIVTVRSSDGGHTWMSLRGAPGGDDYQNMWINSANPNIILLVADQGAIITLNDGRSWSSWYNQPTAQLYHVAATDTFPYQVCSGQQESGSVCTSTRGNDGEITFRDWHPAGIIEYGYAAPDPLHPGIVYGAGRFEVSRFDSTTGQVQNVTPVPLRDKELRADRTEPIVFSPADPHTLYYAANRLFRTTDGGQTWTTISPDLTREHAGSPASIPPLSVEDAAKRRGAIYALAPSFQNTSTVWAGTDDGLLWITRDAGKNWKNITPPELTPWARIAQISASHFDDQTAYIAVSRFRVDDLRPYLYRTHDGGVTWQPIISGLPPDSPVNTIREDPVRKGLLFAGTETGVWFSTDDGSHWRSLQLNLPATSMRDLLIHGNDLVVATHGRSFWVLDNISLLRQLDTPGAPGSATLLGETARLSSDHAGPQLQSSEPQEVFLFHPGEAYRVRRSTYTDTPLPPDEPAGENPPDGAVIDYTLPQNTSGPVTLEILDSQGKLVRHYASTDAPETTLPELEKQLIPLYWIRMPRVLPGTPGMHRWVWNLHYATPTAARYDYPISAVPHRTPREPQGPLALPGAYTVRLTANEHTSTAPLLIRMDPRVSTSPAGLEALFAAQTELADLVTHGSSAAMEAQSLRDQIARMRLQPQSPASPALKQLDADLEAVLEGEQEIKVPMPGGKGAGEEREHAPPLNGASGEAGELYKQISQADTAPTAAQQTAIVRIQKELQEAIQRWHEVAQSIPAVNSPLKSAGLPELNPELKPTTEPEGGDED